MNSDTNKKKLTKKQKKYLQYYLDLFDETKDGVVPKKGVELLNSNRLTFIYTVQTVIDKGKYIDSHTQCEILNDQIMGMVKRNWNWLITKGYIRNE